MSRSSNIRHMQLSYCSGMNNSFHWNFVCVCVLGGGGGAGVGFARCLFIHRNSLDFT